MNEKAPKGELVAPCAKVTIANYKKHLGICKSAIFVVLLVSHFPYEFMGNYRLDCAVLLGIQTYKCFQSTAILA
ncbi:MAG: hypothetical protein IPN94_07255 [Sphingobacteriales bacterium]|nr:hypothetical protein [Sphingobacteriales bacterium]